jgi:transcription-repair coupling factor (superfamily II helicase)
MRMEENYKNHMSRVPDILTPYISSPVQLLHSAHTVSDRINSFQQIYLKVNEPSAVRYHYDFVSLPPFQGDMALLSQDISRKQAAGYDINFFTETSGHKQRLAEYIGAEKAHTIHVAFLKKGFFSEKKKIACYSELEIFNRLAQKKIKGLAKNTAPLLSFDSIKKGDAVVHVDHGIAFFRGITSIKAGEHSTDCMLLEFAKKATIHVPIRDFHKVQKYIGSRDTSMPALSTLGGTGWKRKKERTRKNIQEMASRLIKIYAQREYARGLRFPEDCSWQQEFEDSFLYTPTQDQIKTMEQVKNALHSEKPMDHLVCGDVGFGKTEIAMRAAFKAVMAGYQVAVLAPTTVLASQHGKTFRDRMIDFPVRIATLSRLNSTAATRTIQQDVATGDINILIGTHKILSPSIRYKKLGLVIIDEEQRFGVKQKEKFTELKSSINVLSMSATPIPRTLHMSMAGIRDLSLISTPPQNRLPVETTVTESNDELLQSALKDELERGGQAFVVHNKIRGLSDLHNRVQTLLPQARIGVAHGRMDGDEVEEIMTRFTQGELDILISTTIIENGIDISNANTIIVEEANTMGLSQLYQIRGRVGRSDVQGYAYFFVKDYSLVKEESLQRLKALEQFTDLGSGFQLAMRDLELRGAGNLLGTDQSGTIAAVGFELYCDLLREEIERIRDKTPREGIAQEPELEIQLNGLFPASYIGEANLRILLYQRCTGCKTLEELHSFEREIADRFGPLPEEVLELLISMDIKIRAMGFFISKISLDKNLLQFRVEGMPEQVHKTAHIFSQSKKIPFEVHATGQYLELSTTLAENKALDRARTIRNILQQVLYDHKR